MFLEACERFWKSVHAGFDEELRKPWGTRGEGNGSQMGQPGVNLRVAP